MRSFVGGFCTPVQILVDWFPCQLIFWFLVGWCVLEVGGFVILLNLSFCHFLAFFVFVFFSCKILGYFLVCWARGT